MNKLSILTLVLLIVACGQKTETKENTGNPNQDKSLVQGERSYEKINLNGSAVVVIQLDSLEIERLKDSEGESIFYTGGDDLMWYNSMMWEKMDSLQIPVKYTEKDTIDIQVPGFMKTIVKDTTFSLYTYFYFDGNEIKRTDLFELLGE